MLSVNFNESVQIRCYKNLFTRLWTPSHNREPHKSKSRDGFCALSPLAPIMREPTALHALLLNSLICITRICFSYKIVFSSRCCVFFFVCFKNTQCHCKMYNGMRLFIGFEFQKFKNILISRSRWKTVTWSRRNETSILYRHTQVPRNRFSSLSPKTEITPIW